MVDCSVAAVFDVLMLHLQKDLSTLLVHLGRNYSRIREKCQSELRKFNFNSTTDLLEFQMNRSNVGNSWNI